MKMAERVAELGVEVENLKTTTTEMRATNTREHQELKDVFERYIKVVDKKLEGKASKLTEKIVYGQVGFVMTSVLIAFLSLIIKQ